MAGQHTAPTEKRMKADYTTYITVLVGPDEKSYIVHEGVITGHSDFFRAACSGDFKESKERLVRLPEADTRMFEIMLHWVYIQELVAIEPEHIDDLDRISGENWYGVLADVYVLADQLAIRELRNATIDIVLELYGSIRRCPGVAAISTTYEHTTSSSTLRKFVQDCYRSGVSGNWLELNRQQLPADFLFDLAITVQSTFEKPEKPTVSRRCHYHEHDEGHPKCV